MSFFFLLKSKLFLDYQLSQIFQLKLFLVNVNTVDFWLKFTVF